MGGEKKERSRLFFRSGLSRLSGFHPRPSVRPSEGARAAASLRRTPLRPFSVAEYGRHAEEFRWSGGFGLLPFPLRLSNLHPTELVTMPHLFLLTPFPNVFVRVLSRELSL